MKKNVPALRLVADVDTTPDVPVLPEELAAVLGDIAGVAREGCSPSAWRRGWP